MATSYTSLLGLALPVTGELSGTWGDTVNNYISNYIDAAVAGAQTVTADTTLTKTTGASLSGTSSQYAIIIASPASANITITAPAASKIYTIINTSATYTVKIVGAGPTTGVTLGVSEKAQVAWNGSDFVRIGASGGPGVFSSITNTSLTAGRVVFSSTGGLEADSANLVWDNTNAYLGIGTSSPAVYTANSKLLQIDGGANAAEFKMTNSTTGSTGADGTLFQLNGSAFYLWNLENSFLSFGTNNTERMRLDSSGNLGLGATPSAWGSQYKSIDVSSSGAGYAASGFASYMTTNAYNDNSNWRYKGSTYGASFYSQYDSAHKWYNAPSGTAGNAITFTQAMTLDSSGNLGLGVTPTSAWSGGNGVIEFVRGGHISNEGGSTLYIGNNNYFDGTNLRYKIAGPAAISLYGVGQGTHIWYNSVAGTAGNIATPIQAMTLDASGQLLIKATSNSRGFGGSGSYGRLFVDCAGVAAIPTTDSNMPAGYSYGIFNSSGNSAAEWLLLTGAYNNSSHKSGILLQDTFLDNNQYGGRYIQAVDQALTFGVSINGTIYSSNATLTEQMRLDSSGNLQIGTTSPLNSSRLTVWTAYANEAALTLHRPSNDLTGTCSLYFSQYNGSAAAVNYGALSNFISANTAGAQSGGLIFQTASAGTLAERMRLDSSGNLLVGTTSSLPSGLAGVGIQGGIGFSVSGTYYWSIQSNASDFYIGPSNLSRFAQLNGITTFTAWTFSSDRRIKNSIQDIGYGLAEVLSMQPRQYKFNDDDEFKIGFVAQELKEVVPEAVTGEEIEFSDDDTPQERAKKTMGVSKETLIPVLVKAIQEQQAMIQSLTDRIAQLEAK